MKEGENARFCTLLIELGHVYAICRVIFIFMIVIITQQYSCRFVVYLINDFSGWQITHRFVFYQMSNAVSKIGNQH